MQITLAVVQEIQGERVVLGFVVRDFFDAALGKMQNLAAQKGLQDQRVSSDDALALRVDGGHDAAGIAEDCCAVEVAMFHFLPTSRGPRGLG